VNDVDYYSTSCHVILYTDDILLLASSISELEKLLHACENELLWLDMSINFKSASSLPWVTEIKYLGVHVVRSKVFKCDIRDEKRSFYRSANEIFGKIGRFVPEDVTLQLIQSKCMPALLYGLDALTLNKSEITSLDFVINQCFMKLFCTSDINIVQQMF